MRLHLLLFFILLSIQNYAQNYDAEFLKDETFITYDGKDIVETYSIELRILNARGTKYAEFQIPFQEGNPVHNLEASISDMFGNEIRALKKKEIVTKSTWSGYEFYTDRRILEFKLIHNIFPYIIKYSYSRKIKDFISIAHWEPSSIKNVNTKHASLIVSLPKDTKVNIYSRKVEDPIVDINEQSTRYSWSIDDYSYSKDETFSPLDEETCPCVIMVPETFHYEYNGVSTSWKTFGEWKCKLIDGLDELTPQEAAKVHELTDNLLSDKEKIKVLYHYMQDNTRYILVSEDNGGLIPYLATYVCQNKYGDCKALTNYMKALLKEAGIKAYYSTLYAGTKHVRVNTSFPYHQSNHVILQVPLKEDTVWLECTDKNSPFNYLGPFTQNRYALVVKKDSTKLTKTPATTLDDALESFHTTINLDKPDEELNFSIRAMLKGRAFERMSSIDSQLSDKEKEKYFYDYGMYKGDISDFEMNRPDRDSCLFLVHLNGKLNELTEKLGSNLLVKPYNPINYDLEKPENRINDIFISYPVNKCDTTEYLVGKTISSIKGLTSSSIQNKFGTYRKDYKTDGNKLTIYKSFQLQQGSWTKDEYAELYSFLDQVMKCENQLIIINF